MWSSAAFLQFTSLAAGLSSPLQSPLNSSVLLPEVLQHVQQSHPPQDPSFPHSSTSSRLVMYVQTFTTTSNEPLSLLPLLDNQTKVTHVILGSLHLHEEPGIIMLNNDPLDSSIYDSIWEEVKVLQKNGVKVLALLGGAAGATYARLSGSDKNFNIYYQPLLALIRKYNLDGLDVDIEEDVELSVPIRLLTSLYHDLGPDFLITMAPLASALSSKDGGNLSGFSYFDFDALATVPHPQDPENRIPLVSWYNAQFYGGFARSTWFYESIVKAGWEPSRVVVCIAGSLALGENGFLGVDTLIETTMGLKKLYGDEFGGVAGWEYFDAGSADEDGGWVNEPWRWVARIGVALFD